MWKYLKKVAVVVALLAAALGTPRPAQAAPTLFISVDGGANYQNATGAGGLVNLTVAGAGFTVTVTGTSNQPTAGAAQSEISQISTTISTSGAAVALPNIVI